MTVLAIAWALATPDDGSPNLVRNHAASLELRSSSIETTSRNGADAVVVVGSVHNRSELTVGNVFFYVECRDRLGARIDGFHARIASLIVPPGGEAPFKVVDRDPIRNLDDYASCSVEIRHASALP